MKVSILLIKILTRIMYVKRINLLFKFVFIMYKLINIDLKINMIFEFTDLCYKVLVCFIINKFLHSKIGKYLYFVIIAILFF